MLTAADQTYIKGQIAKLNSGKYNTDDCLWRIASAADLPIQAIDHIGMNERDRAIVRRFIATFR